MHQKQSVRKSVLNCTWARTQDLSPSCSRIWSQLFFLSCPVCFHCFPMSPPHQSELIIAVKGTLACISQVQLLPISKPTFKAQSSVSLNWLFLLILDTFSHPVLLLHSLSPLQSSYTKLACYLFWQPSSAFLTPGMPAHDDRTENPLPSKCRSFSMPSLYII